MWQVVSVLQRFGSGQRSSGVCPFLFFNSKSAPWAARKQAMNELLFLSCPCAPRPIRSRPTSWTSCSCRSCVKVWYLKASWRGVSPSLSATFKLAPSRTSSYNRIYESRLIIELTRGEINPCRFKNILITYELAYLELFDRILTLLRFPMSRR